MAAIISKKYTLLATIAAVSLFAIACSNGAYELTSPSYLSYHVFLRKFYSVVAFTLVGILVRRAGAENGRTISLGRATLAVAAYSAAIEAGQYLTGVREGLQSNAFDVACGAAGGAIATLIDRALAKVRR